MSTARIWMEAVRPKTMGAAFAPVLIGTSMAYAADAAHWGAALCALGGAVMIQVGTNFANDYFDFVKGADTEERLGPTRATAAGLIRPETMRLAFILAFLSVLPMGGFLLYRAGWPLLWVGVLSIASGILYTGGPAPLGYLGLGDIFVVIFFGPVAVGGTFYVQALTLPWEVLVAGLGPGLLSTSMLVVNNLRDVHTDRKAGKRTLAVRLGERFARIEFTASIVGACAIPIGLAIWTGAHLFALSAACILLPAAPLIRRVWRQQGAALNPCLGAAGRLLLGYSVLFSIGWAL
jgi:1,4-dihydroxy-2-naphthoate octaprenyltransferase